MIMVRKYCGLYKLNRLRGNNDMKRILISSFSSHKIDISYDDEDDDGSGIIEDDNDIEIDRYKHGRGGNERKDSITIEILNDRHNHQTKAKTMTVDIDIINELEEKGLGSKRKKFKVYNKGITSFLNSSIKKVGTGAGGHATHLSSCSSNWPVFPHVLPEVAFAGHSNCGKSTLVNAVAGIQPTKGPAQVSDRAGWTDQICFYQLGKRPPVLILADLPGYGHAVATSSRRKEWKLMCHDYLSTRQVLTMCYVLVDCTRGLCQGDLSIINFLKKNHVPWQVVLTKADLLPVTLLAQSIQVVKEDLNENFNSNNLLKLNPIIPISASTGAGIQDFWKDINQKVSQSVKIVDYDVQEHVVREHHLADVLRKESILHNMKINNKLPSKKYKL